MNMNKYSDSLDKYIKNRNVISISRERIDNNRFLSIPIKKSQNYLLLEQLCDFIFNGFMIIKIEDITELSQEMFISKILKKEKIQLTNEPTIPENMGNWQEIFNWLISLKIIVIIECECLDDSDFFIGELVNVTSESVEMLYFDGKCKWDQEITVIEYEKITSVTFYDRYSTIMGRYARDCFQPGKVK